MGGKYLDIVDMHWFGGVGEWRDLAPALDRLRTDLERHGFKDTPIWITEMGTYSGRPGRMPEQTERDQASEVVRRYVTALAEGVEKVFWAWGIDEGFMDPEDDDFFDRTGLIYDGIGEGDPGRGTRKAAYRAYAKMTEFLRRCEGGRPTRLQAEAGVVAYRFRFPGEERGVLVVWLDH